MPGANTTQRQHDDEYGDEEDEDEEYEDEDPNHVTGGSMRKSGTRKVPPE